MTDTVVEPEPAEELVREPSSTATDEQLIAMLVDRARRDGPQLTGEGGLPADADQAGAGVRLGG